VADIPPDVAERIKRGRMERRRLKEAYTELFAEVNTLIFRHDPMGLRAAGCPGDEYEPEVGTILPRLHEARGPDDVERIIQQEFGRSFGSPGEPTGDNPLSYPPLARAVWQLWAHWSGRQP
jgi:hypothetical protein